MSKYVGETYVDIGADLTKLKKGLNEAKLETEKTAKTMGDKLTSLGGSMSKLGKGLTLGVTVPIIGVGAAVTKMAMDAEESENLFTVSMGNMADSARKWSEDLREQLGLNEYETRKMMSTFNVMLDSMGLSEQAAYGMSKGMTQLAYDMASFYNLDPGDTFTKLSAGLSGEAEPLKRLGILVNDTTIKTAAYEHGIAELGAELTETQKVQARYLAIMDQTSKAQGDMARTLDSPTNQLRILKDELKQAGIEFGQVLLPVLQEGIKVIRSFTSWLADLNEEQKENIVKWAAIAAALGPVLFGVGKMLVAIPQIAKAFTLLKPVLVAAKADLLALLTNPVVLGLAALAAIITTIIIKAKHVREAKEEIARNYEDMQRLHNEYVNKMAAEAKAAVHEEYEGYRKLAEDKYTARVNASEREMHLLRDQHAAEVEMSKRALEDQLEHLEDVHEAAKSAIDEEYGIYSKHVDSKMDLVNEFYDAEVAKATEAHNEKIRLLDEELERQTAAIDRESALAIGGIEDQMALLEGATAAEIAEKRATREASAAIDLESLIAAEQDKEARAALVAEREALIASVVAASADKNLAKQKWALQELILEEKIKAVERKIEAEKLNAEMVTALENRITDEITALNGKRDSELQILETERQNKQATEDAKYESTKNSITDQIAEYERGGSAQQRQNRKDEIAKQVSEDAKLAAVRNRVDAEISELNRIETEKANLSAAAAAREAEADKDNKVQELLRLYQTTNTEMTDYTKQMQDKHWLVQGLDGWSGESKAILNQYEREMDRIAGQLKNLGSAGFADYEQEKDKDGFFSFQPVKDYFNGVGSMLGFASGGVVTKPTMAMVGESGPEMIIPQDRFNEVIRAAQSASQGFGGGSGGQVEHRHSGEIKVKGINDRGQLVDTINLTVKDILRQEMRQYG